MTEREKLLSRVQMYDFALIDAGLFLDSHSKNAAALAFYQNAKKLYQQAVADYESKFGPLTAKQSDDMLVWRWIEDPWPWEGAEN